MGYRNLTCHHLRSARLSLSLGQRIYEHCPALDSTFLVLDNLEQNVQASHKYNSSGNLLSSGQACHNYDSSDNPWLIGQLFHNYNISVSPYNHLDAVFCTCCKLVIAQNFVELAYPLRTAQVNPGFLAHFSSYRLSEAFHLTHLSYPSY